MAAKFLLPALALVGTVLAQCDGPITIMSSGDAQALETCETIQGDVIIDGSVGGQIAIDGVQQITGDLKCYNATQLTQISASQLGTIGGTFDLNGLTIMSNLQFSSLTRVNRIRWIALPALQSLNFAQGIAEANQVYISNTGLTTLSGIELTQVGSMDVNNNQYLKTINVNSLTNVTTALAFAANGLNLEIEFPNLQGAANLTFRNLTSISMPSLADVAGSMGFYGNYFESFSAPNLTETGNTIAFVDCGSLSNLSFPSLTQIGGGLQLANNSQLDSINGFNSLKTIVGDINFVGTFSNVQFKSLTDVRGAANVVTSSDNKQICDLFNTAHSKQTIKGNVNCKTAVSNPSTNGSSTGSSGSSSSSSNAADATLFDPSAPLTGFAAFIAALLFL